MRDFYLILSRSNTVMAQLVRLFTRKYYSHASIAFDESLDEFYSFGRKHPLLMFPAGFISEGIHTGYFGVYPKTKVKVLKGQVTEDEYDLLKEHLNEFISAWDWYRYDVAGLFNLVFKKPSVRARNYTCSGFTAHIFRDILEFDKNYSLVEPEDFYKFDFETIYEGTAGDYSYEKQQIRN